MPPKKTAVAQAVKTDIIDFFKKLYILVTLIPVYIVFAIGGMVISSLYDAYIFPQFTFLNIDTANVWILAIQSVLILSILGSSVYIYSSAVLYIVNSLNDLLGIFNTVGLNSNLIGFLNAAAVMYSNTLFTKVLDVKHAMYTYFNGKPYPGTPTPNAPSPETTQTKIKINVDQESIDKIKREFGGAPISSPTAYH